MIKKMFFLFRSTAKTALSVVVVLPVIIGLSGCAATTKRCPLKVSTTPSDALVCLGSEGGQNDLNLQSIAGVSPLEKEFDFGPQNKLWLQIEKRGYAPMCVAVTPDTGHLSLDLERIYQADGSPAPEFTLPLIRRMLVVVPDFVVIERGFNSEAVSEDASARAQQALSAGIVSGFKKEWETSILQYNRETGPLKSLWRDGHTAMELTNPVHLRFRSEPLLLETASGRAAAQTLGQQHHADVIVLVEGKQVVESASMLVGKIGMTVIGTANSYAGGYSRAMANGDSFFVYNIYTPTFAEGAFLKALMIDCRNAEVLWTNKGLWKPVNFEDSQVVETVIADLFTGITQK